MADDTKAVDTNAKTALADKCEFCGCVHLGVCIERVLQGNRETVAKEDTVRVGC